MPKVNQVLTAPSLASLKLGIRGACVGLRPTLSVGVDPEEIVTLTNHGTMKLCSAIARAMMLLPRSAIWQQSFEKANRRSSTSIVSRILAWWEQQGQLALLE